MSERALKRILVAVAILALAYGGVALLRGPDGPEDAGAAAMETLMASLSPDSTVEVRILRREDTLRLVPSDGGWRINGYSADSARVARFWRDLSAAGVTGPVARNPENHARLGVTPDSATRVVFRSTEGEERVFLVGGSGPGYSSAYVRLSGQDQVFLAQTGLSDAVNLELDQWRDRIVLRVDTAQVGAVELVRDGSSVTLRREAGGWTAGGTAAAPGTVERILGALAELRAPSFPTDTATFGGVERRLLALGQDGDTLADLSLSEATGDRIPARVGGDDDLHLVGSYDAGRLFPEPESIRVVPDGG